MARLSDVPAVLRTVGLVPFAKRVWHEIVDDDLFTWGAALAYSWLFAVFPFLIFLLTLLPYLPAVAKDRAFEEAHTLVFQVFPGQGAQTVWDNIAGNLNNLLHHPEGKLLPRLLGIVLTLWAASGGMNMTMSALDKCYEIERTRPFYRARPVAVGLTLVVAVLVVLILCLLPLGTIGKHWVERQHYRGLHPGSPAFIVFDVVRWTLSLFFMVSVLAVVYHRGPSIRHRFHWLTPGGVFAVLVWVILGFTFRLYVEKYGKYNQTYGTVGGVVVLLLFFYLDALVLLVGAEINSEIDFEVLKVRRGTRDFTKAEDTSAGAPTGI